MLNNLFGDLTGGAGGGEPTPTSPLGRGSLFDDAEAIGAFTDHLPPVQGGATIAQEDRKYHLPLAHPPQAATPLSLTNLGPVEDLRA